MNEEHWLIGLSKSGFGAVPLLFRNPTVRNAAAPWDFPADQADTSVWDMLDNYGTDTNFQGGYRLTDAWIAAHQGPFQRARRLWLSYDDATYFGYPTFLGEVSAFAARLQAHGVQFMRTGGATRPHSWASGWLSEAVTGLQAMRYTASDDFNRADGGLGPNWAMDPVWGAGIAVAGNQAGAALYDGGAHFWSANRFGADQYSQITVTGAIGDWLGVSARGRVSPGQGYWLALKADGAHLYSTACSMSSCTTGVPGRPETRSDSRFAPSRRVRPASRSIGMGAHYSRTTTPTTSSSTGSRG
jgi:hypothetical protein